MEETINATMYPRVSSEKQRDEETIEEQFNILKPIIKKDGRNLVDPENYKDDGWSGKTEQTPGFDRLLDDARLGKFQVVYITKLDRLARTLGGQINRLKELKKLNIEVFIKGAKLDETSEGKMLNNVMGAFNQYEAEEIVRRTTAGRFRKAREGKILASIARFGYKLEWNEKEEKIVSIDEKESKVVLYIYDLIFQRRSCHQVAKQLLEEGIKTRHGKNWDATTVKGVLDDKTYIGIWHYGKRKAVEPKKKSKIYYRYPNSSSRANPNEADIIYYKIPAIIRDEKFNAVQELLKEIGKRRVDTKRFYLLNGLLLCAKCGGKMYGRTLRDRRYNRYYLYYYCSTNSKPFHKSPCSTRQVRGKEIEKSVWELVKQIFNNPENVFDCQKTYLQEIANNSKIVEEKKSLLAELKKISQNKIKLLELYEEGTEKDLIKERLGIWINKEQNIKKRLDILENSATNSELNKHLIENVKRYGNLIKDDLELMSESERKELIIGMMKSISFNSDSKQIDVVGSLEGINTIDVLQEETSVLK